MASNLKKIALPQMEGDLLMRRLAREIAIDQQELDVIIDRAGIDPRKFQQISKLPTFQKYLQEELTNWHAATNTTERVKLKASAMIEEWLPEAFAQMHNDQAPLLHKTEVAKLISRLGGMDKGPVGMDSVGERFQVTINLGSDSKLNFDKQVTSKVIEGTTNEN